LAKTAHNLIESEGAKALFETDWKLLSDLKLGKMRTNKAQNNITDKGFECILETSLNNLRELDLCKGALM
jgi:hypothetical protein